MWLVCAGATLALVALSSRHWVAELFSHFRLYYLLAQVVLVMVFLNTRRLRVAGVDLAADFAECLVRGAVLVAHVPQGGRRAAVNEWAPAGRR